MNRSESHREPGPPPRDEIPAGMMSYFLQSASLPVMALDGDGRIVHATRHLHEVLQASPGSLSGIPLGSILRSRDVNILQIHLARVLKDHLPARCELELLFPGGAQWVRLVSHPGQDSAENTLCWSSVENLTQARQSEKMEMFFRRLADAALASASPHAFGDKLFDLLRMVFDIRSGFMVLNNSRSGDVEVVAQAGTTASWEARSTSDPDVISVILSTGQTIWWHDLRSQGDGGGPVFNLSGARPDDLIAVPLRENQKVVGVLAVFTDAPQIRFSAREVELVIGAGRLIDLYLARLKSHEGVLRLGAAIEQVSDVIMISDPQGILEYVNPAFEQLTGYTRAEAIGQTTSILHSGHQDRAFYQELWSTITTGHIWRGQLVNRRKDGECYEEDAAIFPVRNEQGGIAHYVAIKRPVESSSGPASGGRPGQVDSSTQERLRVVLGHEFRNMIMTLRNNAEQLRAHLGMTDVPEELEHMVQAADQAEYLLDQWDVIAAPGGSPQPTDVNRQIVRLEPMALKLLGENRSVTLDLAPRLPKVRLPSGDLEQIVTYLLMRWVHMTPKGSTLLVRTFAAAMDPADRKYLLNNPEEAWTSCVVVEFVPSGSEYEVNQPWSLSAPGAWKEWLARIRQWPGCLYVKEDHGVEPVIRLYLPALDVKMPPLPSLPAPPTAMVRGHETILVAEDDAGARRVMVRMLHDGGYNVLEAENGAMAIRAALYHDGTVDLLLTDLMMPDFDGRALAEQIVALKPGIKVMYASGYDVAELKARDVLPSGDHLRLVKKPFRREELLTMVRQTLDAPDSSG